MGGPWQVVGRPEALLKSPGQRCPRQAGVQCIRALRARGPPAPCQPLPQPVSRPAGQAPGTHWREGQAPPVHTPTPLQHHGGHGPAVRAPPHQPQRPGGTAAVLPGQPRAQCPWGLLPKQVQLRDVPVCERERQTDRQRHTDGGRGSPTGWTWLELPASAWSGRDVVATGGGNHWAEDLSISSSAF